MKEKIQTALDALENTKDIVHSSMTIEDFERSQKAIPVSRKATRVKQSIKEKISYMSAKSKVDERFKISGNIHNQNHSAGIPSKLNRTIAEFNILEALEIEGILQENLWKIQGKK